MKDKDVHNNFSHTQTVPCNITIKNKYLLFIFRLSQICFLQTTVIRDENRII